MRRSSALLTVGLLQAMTRMATDFPTDKKRLPIAPLSWSSEAILVAMAQSSQFFFAIISTHAMFAEDKEQVPI